ncbi:MAG: hypothetical protein K6A44_04155 [bacterium]|nr:hypothetical protein [bacterium]
MKITKILKDGADKLISVLRIKKPFHSYKYCTSVHIHNDVSSILRNRRTIENQSVRILQKLK